MKILKKQKTLLIALVLGLSAPTAYTYQGCDGQSGALHPNGGGFVAHTADAHESAYVHRKAEVCHGAKVGPEARILKYSLVCGDVPAGQTVFPYGADVETAIARVSAQEADYEDIYQEVMLREVEKRARPGWFFIPGTDFYDRVEAIADEEYKRHTAGSEERLITGNESWGSGDVRVITRGGPWGSGDVRVITRGGPWGSGDVRVITRGGPWVYGDAKVIGNVLVTGNAYVADNYRKAWHCIL